MSSAAKIAHRKQLKKLREQHGKDNET
jgi:hypothetical protein